MKPFLPFLLACFIAVSSFAQDVKLNDSVIFINNKPVALYSKELSQSMPRYNMEVYSFDNYVLIKAEVIKFNAPVPELKPFFYYELTFPPTADSFAMYIEDEAFPIVLGKIIRDYDLVSKNELNKKNVARFIKTYYGGPALLAKIKSFKDYLNETRYFNEQVKRDRTKPVTIINDRLIMQDGKEIGFIAEYQNSDLSAHPVTYYTSTYDSSGNRTNTKVASDQVITSSKETQILLYNGRRIDNLNYYNGDNIGDEFRINKPRHGKLASEKSLYEVSRTAAKNKGIDAHTDGYLMRVCYLIENYAL